MAYSAVPITDLLAPDDPRAAFYPQPDVAVLRIPGAPADHACVRLETIDPASGTDTLQLTAFTQGENAPDAIVRSGATLHLEALFVQEGCTLYKLREGQVIGGFSGGPLLNLRTGGVCAVVESSRSPTSDLGGFGVPLAAVARIDSGLLGRNADVRRTTTGGPARTRISAGWRRSAPGAGICSRCCLRCSTWSGGRMSRRASCCVRGMPSFRSYPAVTCWSR